MMDVIFAAVFAFAIGAIAAWLVAAARHASRSSTDLAARAAANATADALAGERDRLQVALAQEQQKSAALATALAAAESDKVHLSERLTGEAQRLAEIQATMKLEFENLASRLLDEKSEKFLDLNQQSLGALLMPLKERIGEFRERMEAIHTEGEKSAAMLGGQLSALQELNRRMADEAGNLTSALKGQSKTQGVWGELVLERILEKSGLNKGTEYETQSSHRDEDGTRRMPDVLIRLPEGRHLIIDAKVSLTAYERLANADPTDPQRSGFLREHAASLRRHVDELSKKDYPALPGLQSPDFVLMFVPVEPALHLALEYDSALFGDAFAKDVVLVSSSTLLVALRAVESVWRRHRQTLNAQEIARQAGKLHDAFVLFVDALEDVGSRIDQARAAYEQAMNRLTSGRGNLVRRTLELEKLGARAEKQLPPTVLRRAEENGDEE
ncbi:MAG: DNA recombination protein RmuC [Terrimicrobiaceae bacterium]|nr:DNA recombination protein RmuC [Terrimicrobiaceae bacterium]